MFSSLRGCDVGCWLLGIIYQFNQIPVNYYSLYTFGRAGWQNAILRTDVILLDLFRWLAMNLSLIFCARKKGKRTPTTKRSKHQSNYSILFSVFAHQPADSHPLFKLTLFGIKVKVCSSESR